MTNKTKQISAAPVNDPLFALRVEERFTMPMEVFNSLESKLGLKEATEKRTWVHAIYFDTSEQAMPLGHVVRARRYVPETSDLVPDKGEYFVDTGDAIYNLKSKNRVRGTLPETSQMLNEEFKLRHTRFRPYVGFQFNRRVFDVANISDMRLTLDSGISGFLINESGTPKPAEMPGLVQVEMKHAPNKEVRELRTALTSAGAVPGVSKHYMLYDKEYETVKPNMLKIIEFPDQEYELKLAIQQFKETSEVILRRGQNDF